MRKTIMLGTLIALFSAGALAQARDLTTTEPGAATEATRPAVRGDGHARGRHSESRSRDGHHEARRGSREHHHEAHDRHHESREHGRRY
jgi:hypothetical protein